MQLISMDNYKKKKKNFFKTEQMAGSADLDYKMQPTYFNQLVLVKEKCIVGAVLTNKR